MRAVKVRCFQKRSGIPRRSLLHGISQASPFNPYMTQEILTQEISVLEDTRILRDVGVARSCL